MPTGVPAAAIKDENNGEPVTPRPQNGSYEDKRIGNERNVENVRNFIYIFLKYS